MVNNVLSYALFENQLASDQNDYMAVTTNAICLDENALVGLMLTRGSTLTETNIMAVLKMEREVICEQAAMGNNITTPVFNLSMSIKGVFNGIDDSYDPARHSINLDKYDWLPNKKDIWKPFSTADYKASYKKYVDA